MGSIKAIDDLDEKTKVLLGAYSNHLETLDDMSRLSQGWVQDTRINQAFLTLCTHPMMILNDIGRNFEIYGSFPKFGIDWRWYKSLYGAEKNFTGLFLDSYRINIQKFSSYRQYSEETDQKKGMLLETESFALKTDIARKKASKETNIDKMIVDRVKAIGSMMAEVDDSWSNDFREVVALLEKATITSDDIDGRTFFSRLVGRELLYVSAINV